MKKIIIFVLYAIGITFIFSGCNLQPILRDQFDLGDTVTVSVNQKLYENNTLWVKLDSVTRDTRCPEGYQCYIQGGIEAKFTVGYGDTSCTFTVSTDSVNTQTVYFVYPQTPGGEGYVLTLISASPARQMNQEIPQRSYRITFILEGGLIARKPNIYLYPETKTKMTVSLLFPHGGKVIESDPFYPLKWKNMKVKPDGRIDRKYDYLFYEAEIPDLWQYSDGWVIAKDDLEAFFKTNMKDYGFNGREIDDFLTFWIPKLTGSPYYMIYPQYTEMVNQVIKLKISDYPDTKLRLHYVIKPSNKMYDLPAPDIPVFERHGFTVTEWGVVLK